MNGNNLKSWRARNGYTQTMLMKELELGSRQTIVSWEKSQQPLSRQLQLALHALEVDPACRRQFGQRVTVSERVHYFGSKEK